MLLADSNVWIALALPKHTLHIAVATWFSNQKTAQSVAFCRATQQAFLRLLTTSAVMTPFGISPLSNKAAWSVYEGFLSDETVTWSKEPRGLDAHWKKLASNPKPSPKLWMDAYLAAFAIASDYQFVTTDAAFRQFKGLDVLVLPKS